MLTTNYTAMEHSLISVANRSDKWVTAWIRYLAAMVVDANYRSATSKRDPEALAALLIDEIKTRMDEAYTVTAHLGHDSHVNPTRFHVAIQRPRHHVNTVVFLDPKIK